MTILGQLNRQFDRLAHPLITFPQSPLDIQLRMYLSCVRRLHRPIKSLIWIFKIVLVLMTGFLLTPVALVLRKNGVRFVSIDLNQIGSLLYLDLLVRENRVRRQTPPKKLFVPRSRYLDANRYCYDLYESHVRFVESPALKLVLSPFFTHPLLRETTFRFDCSATFFAGEDERTTVAHEVWQAHDDRYGEPLVSMRESDTQRGQEIMSTLLPTGKRFVALHVRDNGFYGPTHRTTRNADIHTYEKAIRYLIEQGYAVVRMGDPNMLAIDDMIERCGPDLIDYARSSIKSDFMDCYICSQCSFFVGLTSGLWAIPVVFGRPACNVNCYNTTFAPGFSSRDLSTVKKTRRTDDDSLVPFDAFLRQPLLATPQHEALKADGFYLEDNSSEEILDTLREFLEQEDIRPTDLQQEVKDMFRPAHYCWRARGNYSMVTLRTYFPHGIAASTSPFGATPSSMREAPLAAENAPDSVAQFASASNDRLA